MTASTLIVVATLTFVGAPNLTQTAPTKVNVCGLLPKADVKKLIGAAESFDKIEPKEEPNQTGSSCRYGDLLVMVHQGDWSTVSKLADRGAVEPVAGVGEGAYVKTPSFSVGEVVLTAKVGSNRILTIARKIEAGSTFAATQPGVVALAQGFAAKLK